MDSNSKKVLKIINKLSKSSNIDIDIVKNNCNIPTDDFFEIVQFLLFNDYIKFPIGGYVETTNKGKTYTRTQFISWLSNNLLALIAIIISIIALFK